MEEKKSYYAIIPATVRYDSNLSANAKLLYGEITALCNERGYCWSSNKYFADLYNVSNNSISRWISELSNSGHIRIQLIYREGTREIVNRYLYLSSEGIHNFVNTSHQKSNEGITKNGDTPIIKNDEDNNTLFNNTNNTTSNTTVNKEVDLFDRFIMICNLSLNKNYRGDSKSKRQFQARVKEGYRIEDFKKAVENAAEDEFHMGNGYKYLTPEFLTRADKLEKFMQMPTKIRKIDPLEQISDELELKITSIPEQSYDAFAQSFTNRQTGTDHRDH